MSKLASVQIITDIQPIPHADNIVVASVLGWKVVVKKNEFSIGDKVCYVQIDTLMPDLPEYEFLRERKFRVRTIKLRKQISQGLIVPLPVGEWKEGDDITDIIKVKKYEKPNNNPTEPSERMPKNGYRKWIYLFKYNFLYKVFPKLKSKSRSPFPTDLVPITDEERIQNVPGILESYKNKPFHVSYKLDGSSITIIRDKGLFGKPVYRICSRRFELHDKKNDWYKVFEETGFKVYLERLAEIYNDKQIIVQGEAIGKFNGNHHNLKKDEIRAFNIYVNGIRLKPLEFYSACEVVNMPHCPLYNSCYLNHSLSEILKVSEIPDCINPSVPAEGLVWRSDDGQISFKVINNNYLLTEE